jgi:outer membrane protein
MKKLSLILFVVLVASSCQNQKFGFIDNTKVINDVQIKKDLEKKFEAKEALLNKKADSLGRAFQEEVKVARDLASTIKNQAKLQELSQTLQIKEQNLSRQIQGEKQQLANEYRIEIDSVIVKVKDFVKDYGKTNGYNYIFGTSDNTASVMYGQQKDDLSDKIIENFNAKK